MMADDIYKQMLEDVSDQSCANSVREMLNKFFQRRQFKLQHKRHKYLSRWSHFALTSELVDKVSLKFSPNFSKIQFELEQAIKRHQRLDGEDHFEAQPRPQRIEPNGQINPEDINADLGNKHCSLRIDDIDIYTRIVSYESACNRLIEKFINRAKWVPISHRFDVYQQSQERLQVLKQSQIEKQKVWQKRIETKGLYLIELRKLGDKGFKELQQIKGTMQYLKQESKIHSAKDQLLQSATFNHEVPQSIVWNQVELKLVLEDVCKEFKIFGDMEVDDGNSFTYAVIVNFPTLFYGQVIKTQFAPYDAVPQLINPLEVGRKDILNLIEENIQKYGRSIQGTNVQEQAEIEKQTQALNVEYINQIERALFGEFNNGQLEDFPKVRLRKSNWLPYICFKAEISQEQMQQAALLSGELNPIDQVAVHMLEIININDIQNVNLTLELLSQIHYDKIKQGKLRQEFLQLDRSDNESLFSENQKQFLISYIDSIKVKADYGMKHLHDEDHYKYSLYDTTQHLLFAQYLMICIRSRERKSKLLYTLNAFRSIQKRIALELRELTTRDRVVIDVEVVEPNEKHDLSSFQNDVAKPDESEMRLNGKQGEKLLNVENVVLDELIDIQKFRYQGLTQTHMWSTCPVLPKYHITFGEPIERQEVSTEFEASKGADPRKGMSQRLLGRIDFITEHEKSGFFLVTDDYSINLMYDATFADMRALEQDMLKTMSYFINKLEPMQDTDFRNIFPSIDRFNLVSEILDCEEKYHRAKLHLALRYLECYEHTCDSLEQQRIIQLIVDLMAKRPRINLSANHFLDSYTVEIQLFETQTRLVKEFIDMQIRNETEQNAEVRESLEKTYRLIYEQMDNKWQYFEQSEIKDEHEKRKLNALGVNSVEDTIKMKKLEKAKPGMFQAKQPTVNINQFAEMLGMPISSLKMLLKDHNERDPLVKQSIHEHVSFIKLQEGYPIFSQETEGNKANKIQLVPGSNYIGILEIYESLSSITRVAAACYHAIQELHDVHQPDNGLVSSLQDQVTTEFLLAELIAVREESRGSQGMQSKDLEVIQDSSILGNPEKMLFFIKELIASAEDPNLIQNPFVLTKIDMTTLMQFDFDAAQSRKFKKKGGMLLVTPAQEDESGSEQDSEDADDFAKKQKLHERNKDKGYPRLKGRYIRPNIPSMLEICCNSVEVIRLQHILIEAYHQRTYLINIWNQQNSIMGKENKIFFKDAMNFETHLNGGENWRNFVDTGPGMETIVNTELSIKEFDPSLTAVMNFADPEAFKALVCPLGVEELRAVVRYELLNLQMLIVGVRHNQIILDNCQRQLVEIDLFEKGFLVTAPACDIIGKLQGSSIYESNIRKLPELERRSVKLKLADKVAKCSFSIIAKKLKPKDSVENSFKRIRQAIIDMKFEKVEVGLRYLRTSRILLMNDFCQEIQSQIFVDSMRLELLNEVNQIRKRAYLLPRDSMVHKLPVPSYGEHQYAAYNEENYITDKERFQEWIFYDDKRRQITDFWKVPDFWELTTIPSELDLFTKHNVKKLYTYNFVETDDLMHKNLPFLLSQNQKQLLKSIVPKVSQLDIQNAELSVSTKGRFVDFEQAPIVNDMLIYKYLFYFRQLQNIFDLLYFRCKLTTRANTISTLEQCVMSGVPFWEATYDPTQQDIQSEDTPYSLQPDHIEFRNKLAEQVINKMSLEKKFKIQLITELDGLKEIFTEWGDRMRKQTLSGDLTASGLFLSEQVNQNFNAISLALQIVRTKITLNGEAQKEIFAINELQSLFSKTDEQKVTYLNGYHVNHATTSISRISLDDNTFRPDYQNFFYATLPVLDEHNLNPVEFNLLRGTYTPQAVHHKAYRRLKPYTGQMPIRDFHYLDYKLLNVDRNFRKYIATNVTSVADLALQYAHAKLKFEPINYAQNWNNQLEVFNEMNVFMRSQVKVNKLKNALMILMTKRMLPSDVKEMQLIMTEFNNMFSWKIGNRMDQIKKIRLSQIKEQGQSIVQQIQTQMQPRPKIVPNAVIQMFDQFNCEIDIYQREIQNYMILTSMRIIKREATALASAFEINGKRLEVLIGYNHQFAATLDNEDKRQHLELINQVGPVQKMLTQMKNRMLHIKTITGGDGLIIRVKDLQTILDELCRGIVKYNTIEMKTRGEEYQYKLTQLENLLYVKDQQIYNLEHKLQHAKDQLNKIINTKVFSKGNSIIYELDHTNRQLRLVKDNIYQMELNLKEKVRGAFEKDLERARLELQESRKKFSEYQQTLNDHVKADIKQNINELDVQLKRLINGQSKQQEQDDKPISQLIDEYGHLVKGQAKSQLKQSINKGNASGSVLQAKDFELMAKEMERLKNSEREARDEVIQMQNLIRKQRMIQNFKWLLAKKKWEQKIENLNNQLSSNTTLWDQLAESEKRERVLKHELEASDSHVATLEKVLMRLKDDQKLEHFENQKLKNFKDTKLKRLNQLEERSKQMVLLPQIDIDKVLKTISDKDRKLKELQTETQDLGTYVQSIYKSTNKEVERTRSVLKQETTIKDQAIQKMEALRQEVDNLKQASFSSLYAVQNNHSSLSKKVSVSQSLERLPQWMHQTMAPTFQLRSGDEYTNMSVQKPLKKLPLLNHVKINSKKKKANNMFGHLITSDNYGSTNFFTQNQTTSVNLSDTHISKYQSTKEQFANVPPSLQDVSEHNIFDSLIIDAGKSKP